MSRRLAAIVGLVLMACGGSDEVEESESAQVASAKPVLLEVGGEARDLTVLTAGRFSSANAYVLSVLSDAVYSSGEPETMNELICDAGMEVEGHTCAVEGARERVAVTAFDSVEGDNHAIYIQHAKFGVVVFRGTASAANWLTDAAFFKREFPEYAKGRSDNAMKVHSGFDAAMRRTFLEKLPGHGKSLRDVVRERHSQGQGDTLPPPLYVTGHSLGGAMATAAVASMLLDDCTGIAEGERFMSPRANAPSNELRWSAADTHCPAEGSINIQALYTYGSPRVGNELFAEAIANLMALRHVAHWRMTHEEDLISLIPRRFLGFSHLHLNIKGVPERRGSETFDLREDEEVELGEGALPLLNGRRACGQKPGVSGLPERCPISSWGYLPTASVNPSVEDRPLNALIRLGVGAKRFLDREEAAGRADSISIKDHFIAGYENVFGRLARREKNLLNPTLACEDAATTLYRRVRSCLKSDEEAEDARKAFVEAAAAGECTNVKAIRDPALFYGACMFKFRSLRCEDLVAQRFPSECMSQLSSAPAK